ncbi:MAG: GAF domain-containing protein [Anaerolineae bacterium]|nr:GAF domain-containing protein [Anaerolineae bacterium]
MFKIKSLITSSIRNKFIFIIILIVTAVTLIAGGYGTWVTVNLLQGQAAREETVKLDNFASDITSFLTGLEEDVIFLSQSQSLVQYLKVNTANLEPALIEEQRVALEQEFLAFAKARKIYDQIRFLDTTGQEVVRINTDPDGFSTVVPQKQLQNKAGRYYFEDTVSLQPGEIFVSPLDLNVEQDKIEVLLDGSNKPVIRYGTPVVLNGHVVGVIVTNVLAKNFLDLLKGVDTTTFLVDQDGYYLYHPDESKRWGRDLKTNISLFSDYSQEVGQRLLSGDKGIFTDNGNFFAYQPVTPDVTRANWYLGSVQPRGDLLAPVRNFTLIAVIVITGILLAGVIFAVLIGRFVTAPIIELEQSALRVAEGDFSTRFTYSSQDEIGSLAHSFRTMTSKLRELVTGLEEQVADRTKELVLTAEIGRQAASIRDLDELLSTITEFVRSHFNLYYTHIYFVDDLRQNLIIKSGTGLAGQELMARHHTLPIGSGSIVGQVAASGQSIVVSDTEASETHKPNPLLPDTRSELAVPLIIEDYVIGVLDMQSDRVNTFTEKNLTVFEAMAIQLAISIDSAQQWAASQKAQQRAEEALKRLTQENWSESLINHREKPAYVYDLSTVTPLGSQAKNGGVSIPVTVQNQSIGELTVNTSNDRSLSEDEQALMNAVAQQLAQKAENLRLFEQTQQRATREQIARQITDKIRASHDIKSALKTAAVELSKALGASRAVVDLQVRQSPSESDQQ